MKGKGITGFIFLLAFCVVGLVFKLLHWPFAGVLTLVSYTSLAVFSIVRALKVSFDDGIADKFRTFTRISMIGFSCYTIGVLFQIMHWPAAQLILLIGGVSTVFFSAMNFITGSGGSSERSRGNTILSGLCALLVVSLGLGLSYLQSEEIKRETAGWHSIIIAARECSHAKGAESGSEELFSHGVSPDTLERISKREELKMLRLDVLRLLHHLHRTLIIHHGFSEEEADTLDIALIGNLLFQDHISNHFLIGEDPMNPTGAATELRKKLEDLEAAVSSSQKGPGKYINREREGILLPWESAEFWDYTLVEVLTKLKKMELEFCRGY